MEFNSRQTTDTVITEKDYAKDPVKVMFKTAEGTLFSISSVWLLIGRRHRLCIIFDCRTVDVQDVPEARGVELLRRLLVLSRQWRQAVWRMCARQGSWITCGTGHFGIQVRLLISRNSFFTFSMMLFICLHCLLSSFFVSRFLFSCDCYSDRVGWLIRWVVCQWIAC